MISYKNVTKKYGTLIAVSDFTLEIERGGFFGLLGPNGAGKTTLLRMATTLAAPDSGVISIDGEPVGRNSTVAKRRLGVVPQYSNLEGELSALQNLEYHGRLYAIPSASMRARAAELLEFAGLADRKNDKAKTFSGGMQRKLMIVKALMHEPDILLLDETTVGLDAAWRRRIWDLLRELHGQGLTILLTTHYLEEAQALCSLVGVIDRGRLKLTGSPRSLISGAGEFVIEYYDGIRTAQRFFNSRSEALAEAAKLGREFKVREASLEDVFIKLTQKHTDNLERSDGLSVKAGA
ncbi:MAG: ABC transporter ATP-binding protein [Spirochaetaceae bacterium]|jgi:ABC-2 type transport system ATP-binding protein|nr:ABC transporter ATP-binding protein [Spirochaetaceae bacterium]